MPSGAQLTVEEQQAQLQETLLPSIAKGLVTLDMPNDGRFEKFKQTLAIRREIGDQAGEGASLNNIAKVFQARGNFDTALDCLKHAAAVQTEADDKAGLCQTLFDIGHIHLQNEEVEEAMGTWINAYSIAKSIRLTHVLGSLKELAEQLGYSGGLATWENLAQPFGNSDNSRRFP